MLLSGRASLVTIPSTMVKKKNEQKNYAYFSLITSYGYRYIEMV